MDIKPIHFAIIKLCELQMTKLITNLKKKKKKRWKSGCNTIYPNMYVEYNRQDRGFYDYVGTLEK